MAGGHGSLRRQQQLCYMETGAGRCTCCVLLNCLLLLLLVVPNSLSSAARFPFDLQPHGDLSHLQHAWGANSEQQSSLMRSEHDAHDVVSRELASTAKPPVRNVAHTDYICADSC